MDKVVLAESTCSWCGSPISIMEATKSKTPYANCGVCGAHFSKIPLSKLQEVENEKVRNLQGREGDILGTPGRHRKSPDLNEL